jgi:division protein CdvB (Snf7/Vps24/ESCRT-III family)
MKTKCDFLGFYSSSISHLLGGFVLKKKLAFISFILIFCLAATACSKSSVGKSEDVRTDDSNGYSTDLTNRGEIVEISENSSKDLETRKLIKDVDLTIETKEYDRFITNLENEINSYGGYIQKSDVRGNSSDYDSNRYANIVARIPADKLDNFTKQVSSLGSVRSKVESTQDVTMDYVDIESHIKALKTEKESLLALLKKANNLNDILTIQKTLTDVQYQLEAYESKIRTYDNLIAYSTVTMQIYEVERETPTKNLGMWQEIKNNLSENISQIGKAARSIFIWFVSSSPYLIIIAVIVVVILLIINLSNKRARKISSSIINQNQNDKPEL